MNAIDTNILIYAHFERYLQHEKARGFCMDLLSSSEDWCMGWQVVYEYVRIVTHPLVHEAPLTTREAFADLEPYLSAERGHVLCHTQQHHAALEAVLACVPDARGNFIHDVHYAALLKEHGVRRIYTADSDFKKFGFLEVIDPTI